MRLILIGGTHDGEEHDYVGASLALPRKGGIERQWVGYVAEAGNEPAAPFAQDLEMYLATTIHYNDGRVGQVYLEVEQRSAAVQHEQRALALHERARDYAQEAARAECSPAVNRVFSEWAYAAIIEAQIAEAQASQLYRPRETPAQESAETPMH